MRKSIIGGLAAASVLGTIAMGAAPAFADTPTSTGTATVTVSQSINFAFDSGSGSFALAPNQISHGAVGFTVSTNDGHGYHVMLSAPDLLATVGAGSIPADKLQFETFGGSGGSGDAPGSSGQVNLSNTATQVLNTTQAASADHYTQDWNANLSANTPPGSYQTQLTYTAIGN